MREKRMERGRDKEEGGEGRGEEGEEKSSD